MEQPSAYPRQELEKYYTPAWVDAALLWMIMHNLERSEFILEPSCGDGGMGRRLGAATGLPAILSDISPDDPGVQQADFLRTTFEEPKLERFAIITNPPYGKTGALAAGFVRHALDLTEPGGGVVAMLMRADFDSGSTRHDIFRDHPAFAMKLTLTDRIRWANLAQKENGPRYNHAWFIWDWSRYYPDRPVVTYGGMEK